MRTSKSDNVLIVTLLIGKIFFSSVWLENALSTLTHQQLCCHSTQGSLNISHLLTLTKNQTRMKLFVRSKGAGRIRLTLRPWVWFTVPAHISNTCQRSFLQDVPLGRFQTPTVLSAVRCMLNRKTKKCIYVKLDFLCKLEWIELMFQVTASEVGRGGVHEDLWLP